MLGDEIAMEGDGEAASRLRILQRGACGGSDVGRPVGVAAAGCADEVTGTTDWESVAAVEAGRACSSFSPNKGTLRLLRPKTPVAGRLPNGVKGGGVIAPTMAAEL